MEKKDDNNDILLKKIDRYENTIKDILKRTDELTLGEKSNRNKKIMLFLLIIFSPIIAYLTIIITEFLRNNTSIELVLLWLSFSIMLLIFIIPRLALIICCYTFKNTSIEFPKLPKSFDNMEGEIFNINQYLNRKKLQQTHISPEDIKFFTISNFISIFTAILIYFMYFLQSFDITVKILFFIFLIGFLILSLGLIKISLDHW